MYYIVKTAVYDHGVMWIGENEAEAIKEAKRLHTMDGDNHHNYEVRLFGEPSLCLSGGLKQWYGQEFLDWKAGGKVVHTAS